MPKEKNRLSPSDELKILRKIVDITTADIDLDGVLSEVVKIVTEVTSADSVFIYLFDDQHKNLILSASKTPHKRELGRVSLKVGEGLTGWVAKNVKPLAIKAGAYSDPRFKAFDVLPEDKYDSFLAVPIIFKGKAIGVINLQYRKPHEHVAAMVDFLSSTLRLL